MDNQHRKIKGYRELDQVEIDLMNEIKQKGAELEALIERVHTHINPSENGETRRWVSIGKTHLQQGLMALTRAVAKPDFF